MLRKLFSKLTEGQHRDITNGEIAQVIGVSDATISNFLNYKNELSLSSWLLIIRYLAPGDEDALISIIAEETITTENRLNCRLLMEYASTKRDLDLLSKLINSQSNAPKENKDWAEVYNLSLEFQKRNTDNDELLNKLLTYKPKTVETRLFSQLLISRVLYRMNDFKPMVRVAKNIEKEVEQIKNPYIRESYTARLCEIFAHGYLYQRNDVKKARFYANNIINSKFLCPKFTSHMYHLLGTSFVFESYEDSIKNFQQYYDILIKQGRTSLANQVKELDIFFANVLWGKNVNETETSDSLEKLHYYARNGLKHEFCETFNNVNQDDPFALYYLGVINNDPEAHLKSVAKFIESGNKFFAELPRKELAKHPVFNFSADVMCAMNIA
ncbi:AimR family lysis-lysogeny pheromone receptor [Neobacillus niacini]|uniref:AimR family lysis-lysogeny pheromone receptor n=1 Tax=Neobacillus niacini TaxID=86668 RepID=UPI002FFEC265